MPHAQDVLNELDGLQHRLAELRALVKRDLVVEAMPSGPVSVLVCRVGDQRCCLFLSEVQRVVPVCRLTILPDTPEWVLGLLNLGGDMIPVIDVGRRLHQSARTPSRTDLIIICAVASRRVGLLVHDVDSVADVDGSKIEAVDKDLPSAPFLLGVAQIQGDSALLLSVSCLLAVSGLPETSG